MSAEIPVWLAGFLFFVGMCGIALAVIAFALYLRRSFDDRVEAMEGKHQRQISTMASDHNLQMQRANERIASLNHTVTTLIQLLAVSQESDAQTQQTLLSQLVGMLKQSGVNIHADGNVSMNGNELVGKDKIINTMQTFGEKR